LREKIVGTLIFNNKLPDSNEFQKILSQTLMRTNPVDDLLELSKKLNEYEQKYKLSSAQFFQRYQAGLLDDNLQHCLEWVAAYDLFVKTKQLLECGQPVNSRQ
jgi:hypothetical protein